MIVPSQQVMVGDHPRFLSWGEHFGGQKTGNFVSSGTVNQFGAFVIEAKKVGLANKWTTWIVIAHLRPLF